MLARNAQLDILGPGCVMTIYVRDRVQVASIKQSSGAGGQSSEEVTLTFSMIEVDYRRRAANGALGPVLSSSSDAGYGSGGPILVEPAFSALADNPGLKGCFLHLADVEGGCMIQAYQGWCDALSYSQTTAASWFSQPTQAGGTATALVPLTVTKRADPATPILFNWCTHQQPSYGMQLDALKPGGVLSLGLKQWGLSKIRWALDDKGQPIEELTCLSDSMDLCYRTRDPHGVLGPPVQAHWQVQ